MSAEIVTDFEQKLVQRIRELEPLVAEHKELVAVASKLGIQTDRAPQARRGRPATRRNGSRRRAGTRRDQMLKTVQERPGVTVPEVAAVLGVKDATSLYKVQRQLVEEGLVVKDGTALRPAAT